MPAARTAVALCLSLCLNLCLPALAAAQSRWASGPQVPYSQSGSAHLQQPYEQPPNATRPARQSQGADPPYVQHENGDRPYLQRQDGPVPVEQLPNASRPYLQHQDTLRPYERFAAAGSAGRLWAWAFPQFQGEPQVLDLRAGDENRLLPFDGRVASLRWNLPPGTLVRLYEHADGTGRETSIDTPRGHDAALRDLHMWGPVRAWAWSRPDADQGVFELYAEPHQQGERLVRVLDGRAPDVLHPILPVPLDHFPSAQPGPGRVARDDQPDSLTWSLPAGVTLTLHEQLDGTGARREFGPGAGTLARLSDIPDGAALRAWSWRRSTGAGSWLLQPSGAGPAQLFALESVEAGALQKLGAATATAFAGGQVSWTLPAGTGAPISVVLYGDALRGGPAWVLQGDGAGAAPFTPVAWEWYPADVTQELADRRRPYDRNTWLVARAADASRAAGWTGRWHQSGTLDELLDAGVRGLQLQVSSRDGELLLVRGDHDRSVGIDRGGRACQPLALALASVADFLALHPRDVVTLFLDADEHSGAADGAPDAQLVAQALERAGLDGQVFEAAEALASAEPWPTPAELEALGRRLVLFRGTRSAHGPTRWSPGADDLAQRGAGALEQALDARVLLSELPRWLAEHGGPPTFVCVDFATRGAHGGSRRVVRELNAATP